MTEYTEIELLKNFRKICGDQDGDDNYLEVENTQIPVFIGTEHGGVIPEIVIRPFIKESDVAETTVYSENYSSRTDLKFKHSYFQVDVFAETLLQTLKIKSVLKDRFEDFNNIELLVFPDNQGWQAHDANTWVNDNYDASRQIVKVVDPLATLTKVNSVVETSATNGSWYLDGSGLYVNPFIDIDSLEFFEKLNGKVFDDGTTPYDKGIYGITILNSGAGKDKNPKVNRWIFDLIISYQDLTCKNVGSLIEEMDINVDQN